LDYSAKAVNAELLSQDPLLPAHYYVKVLDDLLTREWVKWEPETLWAILAEHGVENVEPPVTDMVQAAKTLRMNPWAVYDDMNVFENVILALNGLPPDPTIMQCASPYELTAGLLEMDHIDHQVLPFSDDVKAYIQASHVEYGVYGYHPRLKEFEPKDGKALRNKIRAYADSPIKTLDSETAELIRTQAQKLKDIEAYAAAVTSK
jgi:hypothetical protein